MLTRKQCWNNIMKKHELKIDEKLDSMRKVHFNKYVHCKLIPTNDEMNEIYDSNQEDDTDDYSERTILINYLQSEIISDGQNNKCNKNTKHLNLKQQRIDVNLSRFHNDILNYIMK